MRVRYPLRPERGETRPASSRTLRLLAGALAVAPIAGATLALVDASTAGAATLNAWTSASTMSTAREQATATVLQNGNVLVVGGTAANVVAPGDVYNPSGSGSWSATTGSPLTATTDGVSALLSNGEVLLAGGFTGTGATTASTSDSELYNPTTGTFTATSNAMPTGVFNATSVVLPNGQVLVVGGDTETAGGSPVPTNAVSLYNPTTGQWSAADPLGTARASAAVALLSNGNVLAAGGTGTSATLSSVEVYSPSGNTWTTQSNSMTAAQTDATTSVLQNGNVLVAGGQNGSGTTTNAAELYNPTSGTWSTTASMGTARNGATATVLPSGQVLVAGGADASSTVQSSAEIYTPSSATWASAAAMSTARTNATASLLSGGVALVAGGTGSLNTALNSAEAYDAGVPAAFTSAASASVTTGTGFNFTVQTTGTPTPMVTESGTLPAGLTFANPTAGQATVSGTPTGPAGTFTVTFTATNGVNSPATQSFTFTVSQPAAPGYLIAERGGSLFAYGQAQASSTTLSVNPHTRPVVAIGRSPKTTGYYLVTALGNVYPEGGAPFFGSKASTHLPSPITAFAATPDGKGYWLAAANGTVYPFGDASSFSTLSVNAKVRPVVAIATTSDGKGYWLVTSKGNVYNYGDAGFYGSKAKVALPAPIVAFAVTPDGKGYDLVSSKGNLWNIGDASFFGSKATVRLATGVVAFALTLDGKGYYLITSGGNVFNYGDATFYGSPVHKTLSSPIGSITIPD